MKDEERRAFAAVVKLIWWMWEGEMYSMCCSWLLRSEGSMFYSSACLKGLAIISYCSLESRLLEIFLALRVYRGFCLS